MLPSHLFLPALGLALAATCSPGAARAQTYRPDAEAYPCAATARLAIVQDGPGFTIREPRAERPIAGIKAAEGAARALVAIGAAVTFDRKILLSGATGSEGGAHAQHR